MLPIGFENLGYLGDSMWLLCNDAVVARQREILFTEIKGGDECGLPVHYHGFLMGDVELRVRPLDIYPGLLERLESLVIGTVTARPCRVEHDAHIDACILAVDDRLYETFLGERELLNQKRFFRGLDEFADGL